MKPESKPKPKTKVLKGLKKIQSGITKFFKKSDSLPSACQPSTSNDTRNMPPDQPSTSNDTRNLPPDQTQHFLENESEE